MDDSTMLTQRRARGPCILPLEASLMYDGNADSGWREGISQVRESFSSSGSACSTMDLQAIGSRLLRVSDRLKMMVLRSECVLVSAKALLHARTRYRAGGARETGKGNKKLEAATKLSSWLLAHLSNIIAASC